MIEEASKVVRVIRGCEGEAPVPVDGRFFCSLRGGLGVVSRNAPPPKDIRRVKELERLCVLLAVLEDVDLDQRLKFAPCSAGVTDFEMRTLWVETGTAALGRSLLLDRVGGALKDDDLWWW